MALLEVSQLYLRFRGFSSVPKLSLDQLASFKDAKLEVFEKASFTRTLLNLEITMCTSSIWQKVAQYTTSFLSLAKTIQHLRELMKCLIRLSIMPKMESWSWSDAQLGQNIRCDHQPLRKQLRTSLRLRCQGYTIYSFRKSTLGDSGCP